LFNVCLEKCKENKHKDMRINQL